MYVHLGTTLFFKYVSYNKLSYFFILRNYLCYENNNKKHMVFWKALFNIT